MSNFTKSLLALLACALSVASLWADTIKLEGGRTIRGQIVHEKSTDRAVVVRLLVGKAEVTIERSQIQASAAQGQGCRKRHGGRRGKGSALQGV